MWALYITVTRGRDKLRKGVRARKEQKGKVWLAEWQDESTCF